MPTIIDHNNNDFVVWESNVILKYLVDRYDKEKKFHFEFGTKEYYESEMWMSFQVSGSSCTASIPLPML